MTDYVNNPPHYNRHFFFTEECIVYTERMNFCLGNAFKYIYRVNDKDNYLQDLEKSLWCVKRHDLRDATLGFIRKWKTRRASKFVKRALHYHPSHLNYRYRLQVEAALRLFHGDTDGAVQNIHELIEEAIEREESHSSYDKRD